MMQDLVGIVRTAPEMERALEGIGRLRERAARVGVAGNREYNPGWHTALDLDNLLTVSEAVTRARDRAEGEPGRALPRRLPGQGSGVREVQHRDPEGRGRRDAARARADPGDAGGAQAGDRGAEVGGCESSGHSCTEARRTRGLTCATARCVSFVSLMSFVAVVIGKPESSWRAGSTPTAALKPTSPTTRATFRVWRGDRDGGGSSTTRRGVARAWSCSTPFTRSRPSRRTTWPSAGTARPASAARARPR